MIHLLQYNHITIIQAAFMTFLVPLHYCQWDGPSVWLLSTVMNTLLSHVSEDSRATSGMFDINTGNRNTRAAQRPGLKVSSACRLGNPNLTSITLLIAEITLFHLLNLRVIVSRWSITTEDLLPTMVQHASQWSERAQWSCRWSFGWGR